MAHPFHHALSSVKRFGGAVDDFLPVHEWFDATKAHHADFRHRALRHHAEGIFLCEQVFGTTLQLSTCARCGNGPLHDRHMVSGEDPEIEPHEFEPKRIPVRWVGEQHVQEDLGRIPAATEWLSLIEPKPWMSRSRKLSRELEAERLVAAVQERPELVADLRELLDYMQPDEETGIIDSVRRLRQLVEAEVVA